MAIIVAIITGCFGVFGQWLISRKARADEEIKRAVEEQRTKDRLDSIEHKLDIHNGYAEKFGEIGEVVAVIKTEIIGIKERMNEK